MPAEVKKTATGVEYYVQQITAEWRKSVASILRQGKLLLAAQEELPHGQWEIMITQRLPFGSGTARALMRIAENAVLSNRKFIDDLPSSWGTLERLARIPDAALEHLLEQGRINSDLTQKEAEDLVKEFKSDDGIYNYAKVVEEWAHQITLMDTEPDLKKLAAKLVEAIYEGDLDLHFCFSDLKSLLTKRLPELYAELRKARAQYELEVQVGLRPATKRERQRFNRRRGQLGSKSRPWRLLALQERKYERA